VRSNALPTRHDRGEQLRRARAGAQLLRAVLPSVAQLRVELSFEDGAARAPAAQTHVLYPPAPAFFTYRCPHSDCDGEFELGPAVHGAMSQHDHMAAGVLGCKGVRPGEGGAKRPCGLQLHYTITASLSQAS
jgi:hypothetical protein